jgi:hypothetical protein
MSAQPHQNPYFDASRTDDAASFISTLPPPSFFSADTESIAPLLNESQNGAQHTNSAPRLVTASAATGQDSGEDRIIMTSIPIIESVSQPRKNLFNRLTLKNKFKIVLMPQSEYAKYFAKEKAGNYIGTEPQREWTEAELDERYGKYKSSLPNASALNDGGGWAFRGGYGFY